MHGLYGDLGAAQSDVLQAGLQRTPMFDAVATFPIDGGRPDFERTAAISFLDLFYSPLRKHMVAGRYGEAQTRVTDAVINLAGEVRLAFVDYLASARLIELNRSIVQGWPRHPTMRKN